MARDWAGEVVPMSFCYLVIPALLANFSQETSPGLANNPDYNAPPPSSSAPQRSSSTPRFYTTASPPTPISGDDTTRMLPYHSLLHEPKGTSLSQESKGTSSSSIRIDSSTGSHETMLEARKLSKQYSDSLTSPDPLATSYDNIWWGKETLQSMAKMLEAQRRTLGEEHPDTLFSMNHLAYFYHTTGRKEESLQLEEKTMEAQRRILGEEHPDTLSSMAYLANSYDDTGRRKEALQLGEKTLEAQRRGEKKTFKSAFNTIVGLFK